MTPPPESTQVLPNYEHLNQGAKRLLDEPLESRLRAANEDKFVLHEEAKSILSILKQTLAEPECERPSCFVILGAAGTGKTSIAHKLNSDLGGDSAHRYGASERMKLLVVEMPPRSTEPRVVLAMARALKLPVISERESRKVTDIILRKLKERGVRMVVFLEFDHISPIHEQEREVVFHLLKNITNVGISIVAAGTQDCVEYILEDEQMTSRLRPLYLHGFAKDETYEAFLMTLESFYPFPEASHLWRDHFEYIFKRTGGVVGDTVMLINKAASWALRNDRRSIDREALTGCSFIEPLTPIRPGAK